MKAFRGEGATRPYHPPDLKRCGGPAVITPDTNSKAALVRSEGKMTKDVQLVGFRIGRELFGVPIALVHEIVRMMDITAVPEAPEYVEGVINLRGCILPIIDLRKRFHEAAIVPDKKNRILVTELAGRAVGLVVDAASEVLKVPRGDIEPPPQVLQEAELSYVTGVAKWNNRLIILVDLEKVMRRGELSRLSDFAELQPSGAA